MLVRHRNLLYNMLIENIFSTLSKTYTSRRVHIGLDEAHHVGLGKYLDLHGYTDKYTLIMKHLKKVCDIAKKYGFENIMAANDLFFSLSPGVFCSDKERDFPASVTENIPDGFEIVHWDYFGTDEARYDAMRTPFSAHLGMATEFLFML